MQETSFIENGLPFILKNPLDTVSGIILGFAKLAAPASVKLGTPELRLVGKVIGSDTAEFAVNVMMSKAAP